MLFLKKFLTLLLRLAVSAVLLFLLFKFQKIDTLSLFKNLKSADRLILTAAFLFSSLTYLLCFLRWKMLVDAAGIKLALSKLIVSFCGGIFFSIFLPSTIGGDLVRSIDLAAHTHKPREVVATVFLDRLSGYVGMVIVVLFSLFFGWKLIGDSRMVLFCVGIITFLLAVILLAVFNNFFFVRINRLLHSPGAGKIRESLKNLHQEIYYFRSHKKILLKNLGLSVLIQVISPLGVYIIALSLGIRINILYFFVFIPIIGTITLLPVSLGGLGLRENMYALFFARAGLDQNLSVAISLFSFLFILVYGSIGGIIYVLTVRHRRV